MTPRSLLVFSMLRKSALNGLGLNCRSLTQNGPRRRKTIGFSKSTGTKTARTGTTRSGSSSTLLSSRTWRTGSNPLERGYPSKSNFALNTAPSLNLLSMSFTTSSTCSAELHSPSSRGFWSIIGPRAPSHKVPTLSPPVAVRLSLPLPFLPPLPPPPLLLYISIPFHRATENCSSRPVAYFARDVDMQLTLMRATKDRQLSPMGHAPGPASVMAASLRVQAGASASTTTSEEVPLAPTATALTKLSTFTLSAAAPLTMPLRGIAGLVPPLEEPLTLLPLLLDYPDLSHTIKPCPAFNPSLHLSP